jgi:polyisoprenoid-binding protein YceI
MKTVFRIDTAHSTAQFVVRHMMITNVRGGFRGVQGKISYDPNNLADSSIEAVIDAKTIDTRDDQRDAHLRSADFLDVERFPSITFRGAKTEPDGDDFKVTGELTIHGVTRPVVLKVERPSEESKDPFGNIRIGTSATTKIKRSDFGLTWNAALETGGVLVGDEVKIEIELSAIKESAATA